MQVFEATKGEKKVESPVDNSDTVWRVQQTTVSPKYPGPKHDPHMATLATTN